MSSLNKTILTTKEIVKQKGKRQLQMLTCYDFQTATLLDETPVDFILVGDSLGNVILGYENTIKVSLNEMTIFASAVKRGAKKTFVIADMPFGTYSSYDKGVESAINLFQTSGVEAVKLEGVSDTKLQIIASLNETGIPVVGHIGLTPQSVHQQGGYYTHGKDENGAKKLLDDAKKLEAAGVFLLVLECVHPPVAELITKQLTIPTIGIGSGNKTDGQVLVINDLLRMGKEEPPKFCVPIANLYQTKLELINNHLSKHGQPLQ